MTSKKVIDGEVPEEALEQDKEEYRKAQKRAEILELKTDLIRLEGPDRVYSVSGKHGLIVGEKGVIVTHNEGVHAMYPGKTVRFEDQEYFQVDEFLRLPMVFEKKDGSGVSGVVSCYCAFSISDFQNMGVIGGPVRIQDWYHYFGKSGHRVHSNYRYLQQSCDKIKAGRLPDFESRPEERSGHHANKTLK